LGWWSITDRRSAAGRAPQDQSTPYWYPFQTNSGAIREDRLVFPIPPGTHWSEVTAVAVGSQNSVSRIQKPEDSRAIAGPGAKRGARGARGAGAGNADSAKRVSQAKPAAPVAAVKGCIISRWGAAPATSPKVGEVKSALPAVQAKRAKEQAQRIDPRYVSAARELRDRYLERINGSAALLASSGKYELRRALAA
jgi:hypothetical protein